MTARLTALDATFLELEQADPGAHMHIGAVMVLAPPAGGGPPSPEEVRHRLALRLDAVPRFRMRLSDPIVAGTGFPHWEPDPRFDLGHHVRRAAIPAPGGPAELLEWAGDFYSHRLDRARPLWELVVLEGLEGGRWALCTKTHHALADGIGSVDAAAILLDTGTDDTAWGSPAESPAEHGTLVGTVLGAAHAVTHPLQTAQRSLALADLVVRDEVVAAPRTSLTAPLGKHRRLATVEVPLEQVKAIKRAIGGTVNDVLLTAVSGGLRALLVARGETPPAGMRAMVPVNVRDPDADDALGNRISSLFVELPVDEEDALAAHMRVRAETADRKHAGQALGSSTLLALAELAPPALHAVLARSLYGTRLFNVTITNVPGPQEPLFAFGSRVEDAIPIVPIAADHGLAVAMLSLDGRVVLCLNCDRDAVPDAATAAVAIQATFDELSVYAAVTP
ncbi:MAG TPA: wax ester/triacylglycerol synthase family O-acyltransferase [Solirubrobacteraceae bacterium]|nr:wax ester/triacylglycerol synthase family O-acyltransferase [Solirubrobacteraceae bacterium]